MSLSQKLQPEWVTIDDAGAPAEFLCYPLTTLQKLNCSGILRSDRLGDALLAACLYAVKDWRGVARDGNAIAFGPDALKEYLSETADWAVLAELGNKIVTRTGLAEIEKKKLIVAVAVATDPKWAPCGQCDCVGGVNPLRDKWELVGVIKTSRCPRTLIPHDFPFLTELYGHYRNHFLWCAGGISDQPAIYQEIMALIHLWVNKLGKSSP